MPHPMKRFEAVCMGRIGHRPLLGFVERGAFWLLLTFLLLLSLAFVRGGVGDICEVLAFLVGTFLAVLTLILLWRWTFRRLLWTVRNRLILTCLLMGLSPVLLFAILTGLAAYLFAGQFAIDVALLDMTTRLEHLRDRSGERVIAVERLLAAHGDTTSRPPGLAKLNAAPAPLDAKPDIHLATEVDTWVDGKLLPVDAAHVQPALQQPLPTWLQPGFLGTVSIHNRLFLCALSGDSAGGHSVLALAIAPLDHSLLTELAQGLGNIFIYRSADENNDISSQDKPVRFVFKNPRAEKSRQGSQNQAPGLDQVLQGGTLRPPLHFFDRKVYFFAPVHVNDWATGKEQPDMIGVVSRPTLLYTLLFLNSVHIARVISEGLIAITLIFTLLELVALLLAVRLGRTMTRSIAELYRATMEIDRGNLAHRIPVKRKDQLGALATSFNTMSGSLADLLVQQREKERMQSELEIAQEVQNNLFPQTPVHLKGFELHGVCQPARTVSGDYYDFILSGEGRLCFALGDISGKGISAALLMASLHSAVRAYHSPHGIPTDRNGAAPGISEMPLPSPGRMLALLNRHLFVSTQPAKYATLFLACYDSGTRQLTYSNGGHLTPFLLRADGKLERLACGGSVVGLLDELEYPEATIELRAGDLLIAYSDGLTEPENEFEEFGEERLVALIRQNRHESLTAMTTHIMRALQHWIGAKEQPDDMTVVLARQL